MFTKVTRVCIVYNDPVPGQYHDLGETAAVLGVLQAVDAVSQALHKLRHEVTSLALRPPVSLARQELGKLNADIVFNLFEGFDSLPESEAAIASFLEKLGLCFTGSSGHALRLCQDKAAEKQLLRSRAIPTPNWQVLSPSNVADFALSLPCIVKPLGEHASHGLSEKSVAGDVQALKRQVDFIHRTYGRSSLVEEFLSGREFCVLVVGNDRPRVFPVEEIVYTLPSGKPPILTYSAKWLPDDEYFKETRAQCPADVNVELRQKLEELALRSFIALGCQGYARVDMRLDGRGQPMVIDVNPNPDVSPQGGATLQMKAAGADYTSFIAEVLSLAQERVRKVQPKEQECQSVN